MAETDHPHVAAANAYAQDVVAGEIPACSYVRLACQRHLDDLERSEGDWPYRFDPDSAEAVGRFIQLLPHTKGRWAGAKMELEGWQAFIVCALFGWVRKEDGARRFRSAYVEVPRKNGKSLLAAAIGLYMFAADGEPGAEVYSGASTEKQAWEVFGPARLMAKRTEEFQEAFGVGVGAKNLHILETASKFEPIIGKPGDGASPHCAIADELHEHKTDDLVDTMETGMGARHQPLLFLITTAGSDTGGVCYHWRSQTVSVLEGGLENDSLFGIVYTIDEEDDWTTEEALRKANPNYGVSVSAEFLQSQQKNAVASARKQNVFKTKHLNQWVGAKTSWMNMGAWSHQADAPPLEEWLGTPCWVGIDLASKIDIASVVLLFERDGHYYSYSRSYLPEERAQQPDCQHYQGWVHEGHLIATDGSMIDHREIGEDIKDDAKRFGIIQAGCDPYGSTQLAVQVMEEGIEIVEVPQTVKHLSEPMKWVEAKVLAGELHHDGNPCFDWQMGNVVAKVDANDNIFPRKERRENKIDGPVALIIAMGQALSVSAPARSIYEERGALVL